MYYLASDVIEQAISECIKDKRADFNNLVHELYSRPNAKNILTADQCDELRKNDRIATIYKAIDELRYFIKCRKDKQMLIDEISDEDIDGILNFLLENV